MPSGEKGEGDPLGKEQITKRTFFWRPRFEKERDKRGKFQTLILNAL